MAAPCSSSTKGPSLVNSSWRLSVWLPALRQAGLDRKRNGRHLGLHDLRSMNASIMDLEGVDTKTAQFRRSHASSQPATGWVTCTPEPPPGETGWRRRRSAPSCAAIPAKLPKPGDKWVMKTGSGSGAPLHFQHRCWSGRVSEDRFGALPNVPTENVMGGRGMTRISSWREWGPARTWPGCAW